MPENDPTPRHRICKAASASFVLGVLTFVLAVRTGMTRSGADLILVGVAFVSALVTGLMGKRAVARADGSLRGGRLAELGVVAALLGLGPVAVGRAESIRWVTIRVSGLNNLKQLALAMQAYSADYGTLPPAALRDPGGRALLSWRVLLLPYLEERELYGRFHLNEPWDSPHNRPLLDRMPRIYAPGIGNPQGGPNTTFDQVFVGPGTPFEGGGLPLARIDAGDGRASTILMVEARDAVPWTKPADLTFAPGEGLPPLGDFYRNEHYVNPRGHFLALFADGSARCFLNDTPEAWIRPLITYHGGEPVDWNRLKPWFPGPALKASPARELRGHDR